MVTWERVAPDTEQHLPRDPDWEPGISGVAAVWGAGLRATLWCLVRDGGGWED